MQPAIPTWFAVQKSRDREPVCGKAEEPVGKQVFPDAKRYRAQWLNNVKLSTIWLSNMTNQRLPMKGHIYFAGFDPRGSEHDNAMPNYHVSNVNILSLVAKKIIIPPSWHLDMIPMDGLSLKYVDDFSTLYQDGILSSSVYKGMSSSSDFIEYKSEFGHKKERKCISEKMESLQGLFKNIPLEQRNPNDQSIIFENSIRNMISKIPCNDRRGRLTEIVSLSREYSINTRGIPISRESIIQSFETKFSNNSSKRSLLNKDLHVIKAICDESFYICGSDTYNSYIAIQNCHNFIGRGKHLMNDRVSIAYDPEIIKIVLSFYGIRIDHLNLLRASDIVELRASRPGMAFRDRYADFAISLNNILDLSKKHVEFQDVIKIFADNFGHARSYSESRTSAYSMLWSTTESIISLTISYLIPGFGKIWSLAKPILHANGVMPRISKFFMDRFEESDRSFEIYLKKIKATVDDLKRK